MNQDGKRPDTLNFALSRTADGTTAAVKTEHDASSEYAADTTGTNWRVDFGIQPRFNENNTEYVYSVEEAAASGDTLETRGYTRYVLTTPSGEGDKSSFTIKEGASSENNDYGLVTSETVSGVTEKTFHFLNRYTPLKDTLTVNKNWIDDGTFYTWTRPDSVYVDLCYSIDGGDRVNLYTAGNDDPVKKLLKQADANYAFRKEIKATDNWTGRLYNYEYRKSGAEYDTKSEYLTNALATLGEDYSDTSNLWTYWEKIAVKSTDSNGQITFDGHMFGTYVFYEVKAPTGYERDFTHNNDTATTDDTTNPQNTQVIGPVYLDSHNADHGEVTHSLTHLEPRSKAHINVLKTDENDATKRAAVADMDTVLCLDLLTPYSEEKEEEEEGDPAILAKIAERAAAKKAKDYARADAIRAELAAEGITLIDTPQGTTYKRG